MAVPMFVPPPFVRPSRPAHIQTMFQDRSRAPSLTSSHRSADSVASSLASPTDHRYDVAAKYQGLRTATPCEDDDDDDDDRSSLRSFARSFSFKKPKWGLLRKLHRRAQPSIEMTTAPSPPSPPSPASPTLSRKMSSNLLSQLHSRQNSSMLTLGTSKSSSPTQLEAVAELSSRKCYYSIARNCPGYVINGSHGDACDTCLQAGFFGSP